MGQKINATGLRVGIKKDWTSVWYTSKDKYGETVYQDYIIRKFIRKELRSAGVDSIEIRRYMKKVEIEIRVARPGVVIGRGGTQIEKLKESINKLVDNKVELKIVEVKDPEVSAQLIADRLVEQLERRVVPKFVMTKELEKAVATGKVRGIRIWVSGRIKGAEIARTEKVQWGTIPLQTLEADITYATSEAQVPNAGKQGVKVWIYKGKEKR
ncbi:30S ribosomal protein S3 [Candidatus Dojkabacteria bacterium]|nr:30S ribosomal protein S3 [Candidatus Dojkabacteria bacterium]